MSRPRRAIPKPPKTAKPDWASSGACPACGKRIYESKKAARRAARVHHPHDNLSSYECRSKSPLRPDPAPWHIGHLDDEIKHGTLDRSSRYEDGVFSSETVECTYRNKDGLKCSLGTDHKPQPHLAQVFSGDWVNIDEREGD